MYIHFSFLSNCNNGLRCLHVFSVLIMALASQISWAAGPYAYNMTGDEVTDAATGLVWKRCSAGQVWNGSTCNNASIPMSHEQALAYAAGQAGWRLPNVKELASIVDNSRVNPSIDVVAFPNTYSDYFYWTSSPYVSASNFAWYVEFWAGSVRNGYVSNFYRGSFAYYVRLVR
jgi:Protein of unknown function (DUF1566)